MILAAVPLLAAENPWAKVEALKSGQEVRVVKKDARQPLIGAFDELTPENLLMVVKKEQIAVPRDAIERIDARPTDKGSRMKTENKTSVTDPPQRRGMPNESTTPQTNTSSGVSFGGKAEFETVYRRLAMLPNTPPK
jgi:hypothetical protein